MRSRCVSRSVSLPLCETGGTNSVERKHRIVARVNADAGTKSLGGATCSVSALGFEVTVTSTGQQDIPPPRTGLLEFGFAGALVAEWWGQFGMSAIRSGWLC
jgi:hypothetical protein